jgi:hypothetical protein
VCSSQPRSGGFRDAQRRGCAAGLRRLVSATRDCVGFVVLILFRRFLVSILLSRILGKDCHAFDPAEASERMFTAGRTVTVTP